MNTPSSQINQNLHDGSLGERPRTSVVALPIEADPLEQNVAESLVDLCRITSNNTLEMVYRGSNLALKCNHCDFRSERWLALSQVKSHLITHLSSREESGEQSNSMTIRCGHCYGASYATRQAVATHFRHCVNKAYTEFINSNSETRSPARIATYSCQHCDKAFSSRSGLGVHQVRSHPELKDANSIRHKKRQWSDAEALLLAREEATLRLDLNIEMDEDLIRHPSFEKIVLERLKDSNSQFERTLEAIKGQRKKLSYRELMRLEFAKIADTRTADAENEEGSDCDSEYFECDNEVATTNEHCQDCLNRLKESVDQTINVCRNRNSKQILQNLLESNLEGFDAQKFVYGEVTEEGVSSNNRRGQLDQQSNNNNKTAKNRAKKARVAKERDIYESKGPKKLLDYLRNPTSAERCSMETAEAFRNVFEQPDTGDTVPIELIKVTRSDPHAIHAPITGDEVTIQLNSIGNKKAPGIDGVTAKDLKDISPSELACLFNLFLLNGDVPKDLKLNRTTMIPKKSNPTASDWRPITVASMLDRLFAKIIERRMQMVVVLNPLQRAFLRGVDGCGENITAMSGVLRIARESKKPLSILQMDLAKAFDSVQHSSIKRAMTRMGLDSRSIELIDRMNKGNSTTITCEGGEATANLQRGIRQGWPLSPLLFICVVDELIDKLDDDLGFTIPNQINRESVKFKCAAFADDLAFYSNDLVGLQAMANTASKFFGERKMRINPSKSSVLYLRKIPRRGIAVCQNASIEIEGESVPSIGMDEFRMLGVHMNALGKVNYKINEFLNDMTLVEKCQIKPTQKLAMIRECLIPMIKFRLVHGLANVAICNMLDKKVRAAIRRVSHQPKFLQNDYLYIRRKDGGEGMPCIRDCVFFEQCKLQIRMRSSSNPSTRALTSHSVYNKLAKILARDQDTAGLTLDGVHKARESRYDKLLKRFRQTRQGYGFEMFSGAPRNFLDNPSDRNWTERSVVEAKRLRTNTLLCRETVVHTTSRQGGFVAKCRGCDTRELEDLAHILGSCKSTHESRIKRHDSVKTYMTDIIKRAKDKGNTNIEKILPEYSYRTDNVEDASHRRPDITVVCSDAVVLIEISVVYEGWNQTRTKSSLEIIRAEKLRKYGRIRRVVAMAHNREKVSVNTLIVGVRGGWLSSNDKVLKGLGLVLSRTDANILVERAVSKSLAIYRDFTRRFYASLYVKVGSSTLHERVYQIEGGD